MSDGDTRRSAQYPGWQLLASFSPSTRRGSEVQSGRQVAAVVQALRLPLAQVERIGKAVAEALQEAGKRGDQDRHNSPVIICIWISRAYPEDPSSSSSEAPAGEHLECRGWGFFLVQKQGDDSQALAGNPMRVIELFLYQERAR